MSWKAKIVDYKHYLKIERALSNNSIENYERDVQKLVNFINQFELDFSPLSIRKEDIQQFIYEISKVISLRTQARIISGLRSFFEYLVFEDYRKDNPLDLIKSPKIGRTLPDVLSNEEISKIIQTIDLSHPQGERNRTILETMYGCGLRVSELINLKLSDLFFEEGFIKIKGKGNKVRFVPIHSSTMNYIHIYLNEIRNKLIPAKQDSDILFLNRRGKRLTRQMIFIILKDLCTKANINKNVSPHTLRHSFATYLLKEGVDLRAIQQLLGHESITTTEIYVHLDASYLKTVIEQFHPRKEI
ncbi:tyrosine recombinase XerD [Tenacibaculum sp. SZ-18]|uniref:site-specific tyrosine recombinase/integron integrase n=1 Tax=Tenacibaculum sp. SZ-18 TaxID=754423 RepID=UPI000C2D445D|nr:site-specific tyrosine recombinase/integron integrase [Tenacibaculum sp. SZ-18]AUC14837.1 tyrosine recombinase XerD [Tenacibaculum sp. SZ-18]